MNEKGKGLMTGGAKVFVWGRQGAGPTRRKPWTSVLGVEGKGRAGSLNTDRNPRRKTEGRE